MANKDIIIPFKFCRLDRAAKLLKCDAYDLINLGVNDKLSICVNLDGLRSVINMNCNVDDAIKWYEDLKKGTSNSLNEKEVTEFSLFNIYRYSIDEDENPISLPLFTDTYADGTCFSNIGSATGLWRIWRGLDDLQNYGITYFDGTELEPCLPVKGCPAIQLLTYVDSTGDDEADAEWEMNYPGMRVTTSDLWITAHDVRRLLDVKGDYYNLENYNDGIATEGKFESRHSVHHSAERHACNREKILMAALRLREQQSNVFEESCRKTSGEINFSAWARELMARPDWFAGGEPPIKAETKIAEILSNAHKSPSERKA